MLRGCQFVGMVPVVDAARAKSFYCDLLGLPLLSEDDFAVVVDAAGTPVRLTVVPSVPEPVGTTAGWAVDDISETVRGLAEVGVRMERFAGMEQDDGGVWRPPGGGGVAWFRDPDGNRLSVSERP